MVSTKPYVTHTTVSHLLILLRVHCKSQVTSFNVFVSYLSNLPTESSVMVTVAHSMPRFNSSSRNLTVSLKLQVSVVVTFLMALWKRSNYRSVLKQTKLLTLVLVQLIPLH